MKKLMLCLSLVLSFQAFGDCRPQIQSQLDIIEARNGQTNQNLIVGNVLGGILAFVYAPLGLSLIGISVAGSGLHELNKGQLRKLKGAIDEAYVYNITGEEGKNLKKMLRKVKRKIDARISMQELVDAVVESNHSQELCSSRSIRQFSKRIIITLD